MRIDFNQLQSNKIDDPKAFAAGIKSGSSKTTSDIPTDGIVFGHSEDNIFSKGVSGKKSILEQVEKTDVIGADMAMEQMLVVAQTMSPQDAKQMADEGYDLSEMDPADAVNSLDRMKIHLAEAGVNVAGYTDTVSADKVAEVTGQTLDSGKLASESTIYPEDCFTAETTDTEIAETLVDFDLPASDDNISSVREAINMTAELKDMTENTRLFLAAEGMEPTIANVFRAEFSSGRSQTGENTTFLRNAKYVADDMGYVGKAGNATIKEAADGEGKKAVDEGLEKQIKDIIRDAGYEPDPGLEKEALSMINAGVPLTSRTLQIYEDAARIDIRPSKKEIMNAIALGGEGKDAYLIADYRKIKAERMIKETALSMATEANQKNLDRELTIDTGYLERDVESLKTKEKEAFDLLEATLSVKKDILKTPAELIAQRDILDVFGQLRNTEGIPADDILTLDKVHEIATDLSRRYEAMNATYEAVGTETRADLGDSIKKAFANTDFGQILSDLGIEQNAQNERAVRIISYSHMELNAENVKAVSMADERLNAVLDRLTPARVLKLIRDNVNPLETGLDELETRLEGYENEELKPAEDFARYLVSETNKGNVTDEEAASYIGIYRLVNAINAGDHKVVGMLMAGGAEINFENMLSAVRTGKRTHVDQYIDANFGGKEAVFSSGNARIDEMIRTAFSADASGQEYYEEEAQKFAEAAKAEAELYKALERADIPQSAANITAYEQLTTEGGNRFARELYDRASEKTKGKLKTSREKVREDLESGDADKIKEAYDEMVKAELIASLEGETLDIRAMRSVDKSLSIKRSLAQTEDYHIPAEFGGELININLRIRHGENQNSVDIYFETEEFGSVHAELRVTDGVRGAVSSERAAGDEFMRERLDAMKEAVSRVSGKNTYLNIGDMDIPEISAPQIGVPEAMDGSASQDEAQKTGNATLYRIAKAVLDVVLQ
jgi:hypothetical protein